MRIQTLILLLGISTLAIGQRSISFRNGDHIFLLEDYSSIPIHHQVDYVSDTPGLMKFYQEMIEGGIPLCEISFDPDDYETVTTRVDNQGRIRVVAMVGKFQENNVAVSLNDQTQPIFYNGRAEMNQDRFLVIETPQFSRATSFKICTNNRVFVFVKHPRDPGTEL